MCFYFLFFPEVDDVMRLLVTILLWEKKLKYKQLNYWNVMSYIKVIEKASWPFYLINGIFGCMGHHICTF